MKKQASSKYGSLFLFLHVLPYNKEFHFLQNSLSLMIRNSILQKSQLP